MMKLVQESGGKTLSGRLARLTAHIIFSLTVTVGFNARSAPVHLVKQPPLIITNVAPGVILVDFGRVAFGDLQLNPPKNAVGIITVRFGEAFAAGRIDHNPPGSVRFAQVKTNMDGFKLLIVAPPADPRNTTNPAAILTPRDWGVLLPFRWVEIENWPGALSPADVSRRAAFSSAWNDDASAFDCSDEKLNRIWDLCRYSIKATTFAGMYVDGDRERVPYEADAYMNQISQYYADGEVQIARDTFDYLMAHPTWPTEWSPHMIFMAYADWMQTGDTNWLAAHYEALKSKLLLSRAGPDGLVRSDEQQVKHDDIVDWPLGERDGFVFTPVNTVVNAFHLRSLHRMAELAAALHRDQDAASYRALEQATSVEFQKKLFDPVRGLYCDGLGTKHVSLHANLFPLAFGLVPETKRENVARWLASGGMACSVYAAQYLLEGLFENGYSSNALALMTAGGDRSWSHMVKSGTTITWEAWDAKYKPNLDWNHAWGAAPANLLPRFVLGVEPLTPGWERAMIQPHPGSLTSAKGKVPTPLGLVQVDWENRAGFKLSVTLPPRMRAQVEIPAGTDSTVYVNGKPVKAHRHGQWWSLDQTVTGMSRIETKSSPLSLK